MDGMAVFMVAVGGTSLICYFLMNRAERRKAGRDHAYDGTGSIDSSSADSWNLLSRRTDSSSHDCASSSGCGGDSGGGGGGGGGD